MTGQTISYRLTTTRTPYVCYGFRHYRTSPTALLTLPTVHTTSQLGSEITPYYKANDIYVNPPSALEVSVEHLIASQTHFGHATSLWHPANSRYIFGVREGIHIISSDVTAAHLRRAAKVVSGVAERGGIILFMNSRQGHERMTVRAAELAGACHLFEKWIPGTITNGQQILGRCRSKVVDEFDREVEGFDAELAELPVLKPDLIVCMNPLENYVMLHECGLANIPTVGIIDTDCNPTWVTYPIPANDDSIRSVALVAGVLGRAGQEGRMKRLQAAQQGRITYVPADGLKKKKTDQDGQPEKEEPEDEAIGGDQLRMGQGTNYFEAGLSPSGRGSVLGSSTSKTGSDVPDDTASGETKANPGKQQTLANDRALEGNVDAQAGMAPLSADPAGSQGTPGPARQSKQEDKEAEQGGPQV